MGNKSVITYRRRIYYIIKSSGYPILMASEKEMIELSERYIKYLSESYKDL